LKFLINKKRKTVCIKNYKRKKLFLFLNQRFAAFAVTQSLPFVLKQNFEMMQITVISVTNWTFGSFAS